MGNQPLRLRDVQPLVCNRLDVGREFDYRHDLGVWLLYCTLGGAGRVDFPSGGRLEQRANDLLAIRPGVRHRVRTVAGQRWRLIGMHFHERPRLTEVLTWPEVRRGVMTLRMSEPKLRRRVLRHLHRCRRHVRTRHAERYRFALNDLEAALLWCRQVRTDEPIGDLDPRLRRAVELIETRYERPIARADLAEVATLSEGHLTDRFKRRFGLTPMQYLERYRIDRAKDLLRATDLPVGQIAGRVGYGDPLYFSQRFKAAIGLCPTAWRRSARSGLPLDTGGDTVPG